MGLCVGSGAVNHAEIDHFGYVEKPRIVDKFFVILRLCGNDSEVYLKDNLVKFLIKYEEIVRKIYFFLVLFKNFC